MAVAHRSAASAGGRTTPPPACISQSSSIATAPCTCRTSPARTRVGTCGSSAAAMILPTGWSRLAPKAIAAADATSSRRFVFSTSAGSADARGPHPAASADAVALLAPDLDAFRSA